MGARRAENCRVLMRELASKLSEGRGITTQEVLAAFLRDYSAEIEKEKNDLAIMGLSRIAGDLARPRMGIGNGNQLDMFGDLTVAETRHVWVVRDGKPKHLLRHTEDITVAEAEYHLAEEERRKVKRQSVPDELQALVDRARQAGAEGDTKLGTFKG